MIKYQFIYSVALGILILVMVPLAAFGQMPQPEWDAPPRLVDEPPGIAQLRMKYQNMTEAELITAGFQVDPVCVSAAMVGLPAE